MTEPRRLAPVARTRERSGPMASARTRVTRGTSSVRSLDRAWTYQLSSIRSPEADTKASLDPDPDRRYDPRRPEGVATELVLAPLGLASRALRSAAVATGALDGVENSTGRERTRAPWDGSGEECRIKTTRRPRSRSVPAALLLAARGARSFLRLLRGGIEHREVLGGVLQERVRAL